MRNYRKKNKRDKKYDTNPSHIRPNSTVSTITNLVIPYVLEPNKIQGIYLSPYHIGEQKRIEVVVVMKENQVIEEEISMPQQVDHLVISMKTLNEKDLSKKNVDSFKLYKELKYGYTIYDANNYLHHKKGILNKNDNITPFTNSIELDDELIRSIKTKIRTEKKKILQK